MNREEAEKLIKLTEERTGNKFHEMHYADIICELIKQQKIEEERMERQARPSCFGSQDVYLPAARAENGCDACLKEWACMARLRGKTVVENEKLTKDNEELLNQIRSLIKENLRITGELADKSDECKDLKIKLEDAKVAREFYRKKAEDGEIDIGDKTYIAKSRYNKMVAKLTQELADLKEKNLTLGYTLATRREELADSIETIETLKRKVTELEAKPAADAKLDCSAKIDPEELSGDMARSWLKNVMAENKRLEAKLAEVSQRQKPEWQL